METKINIAQFKISLILLTPVGKISILDLKTYLFSTRATINLLF